MKFKKKKKKDEGNETSQEFLAADQKGSHGTRIHVGLPKELQGDQAGQHLQILRTTAPFL